MDDQNLNEKPTHERRAALRRITAVAIPAVIGAGAALGVMAATVGFDGGTTTVIRESPVAMTQAAGTTARTPVPEGVPEGRGPDVLSVQEVVRRASPAVVLVSSTTPTGGGLGSGFLANTDGRIITNAHVVKGAEKTTVTFSDGTVESARILGVDESTDIAVLGVARTPKGVTPVPLGRSDGLVVGQDVVAIGNPYGFERTATTGIVSALKRVITSPNGFTIQNVIQTDAAINQGNSGGPLFDRDGRVIGMNSQIARENGGNVGIGFAIPIDTILPIADSIARTGVDEHAWIGITGRELTPGLAAKMALGDRQVVLVSDTDDGGHARDTGMRSAAVATARVPTGADLIVAVNGRPITDMADVSEAVASRRVGDQVTVTVLRDGQTTTLRLTLKDRPADIGAR